MNMLESWTKGVRIATLDRGGGAARETRARSDWTYRSPRVTL